MTEKRWHKVAQVDDLPDGRVTTVQAGRRSVCLTHCGDRFGALDNRCPHQGGPLGEGSIEKGWLRCPWHGYDYDPLTGRPPAGLHRRARRASRSRSAHDGIVRRRARRAAQHVRTVSDVMVETMVNWGVTHVFGMVGHSNLGLADALRRQEEAGRADLHRHPPRGRGGRSPPRPTASSPAGRPPASAIAGPGSTNLLTGLYDAKVDRAPVLALSGQVPSKVLGRGAFQDLDLTAAFADVAAYVDDRAPRLRPRRADDAGREARHRSSATSPTSSCPTRCRSRRPRRRGGVGARRPGRPTRRSRPPDGSGRRRPRLGSPAPDGR